ncbi:MAG TPA: sigma 54-interacting transcriptional regulator [Pseudomonadota bacterium]|jgi:Nif-specific regulatory protein|nr:sigma 54-interacting transcriptional regulator [Pseudomonadota bacterium]HNF97314.1 sigma 54-interacting transcriptional regulator [Pseudomonadota bacterium]HNI59483.1 sigma 54-interacting transcriptional regulator [Pseudomonadota bacterium]HNK43523.1 sigma 54-interacting transcriptional regulator [Pseudomonadota bacterium]HNN49650.1 sigma 54-interacting transcriptional regulator [Pseudomonadota bacterium]
MIALEVLSGSLRGQRFLIREASFTIGRAPHNNIVLPDVHLSSEHAQIFREDDKFIFKDLRSTNGSRIQRRDGAVHYVDATTGFESVVCEGDRLLLGDPLDPVILGCVLSDNQLAPMTVPPGGSSPTVPALQLGRAAPAPPSGPAKPSEGESTEPEGRVLARRPLTEAEAVAGKVERDPVLATGLLALSKRMGRRGLDLQAVFEGIAESVFELVPLSTHIAIELTDGSEGKMATVFGQTRKSDPKADATKDPKREPVTDGKPALPIRASRAVIRRVLSERAAVLIANAPQDLAGAASIMGARIQSIIGVPLWDGDEIRGVIQCDNRSSAAMFRERDLEVLLVLAGQASLAIENARLHQRLRLAEEQLRAENRYLKSREEKRRTVEPIGQSPAFREVLKQVQKVTDTRATVCIEGETGTGKELVASLIHGQSSRRDKLFVAQNCAAVPDTLLESELFGHKKGAFTGADADKKGLFEVADGGTLFLDEIGEMSLGLQAKLLRVLQESEVRPVGATQPRKVDVRILCATNRSLEKEVAEGRFRQDLYYRLKVYPIRLPALRERREDIGLLAEHFLQKYSSEMKKPVAGFTSEALAQMAAYNWPGNVRELENEVQRLVIQVEPEAFITPDLLAPRMRQAEGLMDRIAPQKGQLKDMMEEVERFLLIQALKDHGGNKTRTAETLGITREGLHKKLAKFGL